MDHKDYADLVERLQEPQVTYHPVHGIIRFDAPDDICIEAAERIKKLEAALLEIFDHECRASSKSFIACTAREALWPNAVLGEKK